MEQQIIDLCLRKPTSGFQRIANELRLQGVDLSPSGVHGVWLSHGLKTRDKRLLRPEALVGKQTHILTDEQFVLMERHSPVIRMRNSSSPLGDLLNQDTFYRRRGDTLMDVGKIYVQVVIDAFCPLAFAKLYTSKRPITAADLLSDNRSCLRP